MFAFISLMQLSLNEIYFRQLSKQLSYYTHHLIQIYNGLLHTTITVHKIWSAFLACILSRNIRLISIFERELLFFSRFIPHRWKPNETNPKWQCHYGFNLQSVHGRTNTQTKGGVYRADLFVKRAVTDVYSKVVNRLCKAVCGYSLWTMNFTRINKSRIKGRLMMMPLQFNSL